MRNGGAWGLNWNLLRRGIEIDSMTKSDLVIDINNSGPCPHHHNSLLFCIQNEGCDVFLFLLMRLICFSLQGPFSLLVPVSGMQSFKHPCFNLHTTSRVPSGGVSSWTNLDPGSSGTDEAVTKEILGYFRLIREITMRPRCCEARGLLMLLTGLTLRARYWRRVMFEWSELMFVNNQCCWVGLNSTLITCTESIYGLLPGPCGAQLSS